MKAIRDGWLNGLVGVVIFAGSLPATRVAVMDMSPTFLTAARAAIAGVLALFLLILSRQKLPERQDWLSLLYVSIGVVVGFPLFTALALQYVSAAHTIVFIGLLPLATAIFGVIRSGERPSLIFWLFAIFGASLVFAFLLRTSVVSCSLFIIHGSGDFTLRFWLCRRWETVKAFRWLASDLLGFVSNTSDHVITLIFVFTHQFRANSATGKIGFSLCIDFQYVDWFLFLV